VEAQRGDHQVTGVEAETTMADSKSAPVPDEAEPPAVDPIMMKLDYLQNLFRRRLNEDTATKMAVQELHDRLQKAQAVTEMRFLMPLAQRLFQVVDRLDMVVTDAADGKPQESPAELATSIADEIVDILAMYELEAITGDSAQFDSATQEVVSIVENGDAARDGRVVAVRRRGWRLGARVLRPAVSEPDLYLARVAPRIGEGAARL
jgi:molecular chaperone GrpE (heat shock protein)